MSQEDAEFQGRWMAGADAIAKLYVALVDAPFEEYERAFLALQRELLALVKTPWEQVETRRRIAEEILLGAFGLNAPWSDFGRALRRIRRLGYTDVERRVHVAILFARWAKGHPEHLPAARRMLGLAERHFQSLSSEHAQYGDVKGSLELIRQEKEFSHSRVTARRTSSRR
ncbi:hypothetical protein F0U60_42360 [Archangium minus]|uniref:Uncharacterized protein n=1 Tax=Archangium minus TaxID=83450 RepID=A0ABY9X3R7_9BACT|nr:hypothetical protein F0U60_42360 [Archangium minus]